MSSLNDSGVSVARFARPLIKHGLVIEDTWLLVSEVTELESAPAAAQVLVPLALWQSARVSLLKKLSTPGAALGVQLAPADEPAALAGDVERLALIAVQFPQFTDGRGYSNGRLLRERYGYRGELRAIGDVQCDQLFYLVRCGFDAFVLRADKDPHKALSAYDDFCESYQSAVNQPVPLFRRRQAVLATLDRAGIS